MVRNGKMSMGDYWAVSQYATVIFAPIQILASISVMVQPGTAALSRIGTIFLESSRMFVH